MIDTFVSYITYFIIFVGLYFTSLWVLTLLQTKTRTFKEITFPSVTILIPAYNEEKGIEKTLKSCLNLNYPGKLEIVVVNDASKDRTVEIVSSYKDKGIKLIDLKKNLGKAGALNRALKQVKTDFFAVVDADSVITKNSLKKAIQHFEPVEGQEVGAVISKMLPNNASNLLERIQIVEYMMVGLMRFLSASLQLLHLTPGVLSVYKTSLVKQLGGFDHNNMTEDFELGVKIRKAGYLVMYSEESLVHTTTPSTLRVFLKQRIRWSRGFIQTHKKHSDLFFNKNYGIFGLYQFPMNIIGPIIYFLGVFAISYKIIKSLSEFLFKLIYTPSVISWFEFSSLQDFFLTIDPTIDVLIWISIFFFFFFVWSMISFYKHNFFKKNHLKYFFALFIYLAFYNYIYIYVWIVSLYYEVMGHGYSWGTKQ
jgi:cellulose synthase/poly-beta-1,6-N-acetylglucosamine synthase-like glycosyltransferase